jgi:hypothetical protein
MLILHLRVGLKHKSVTRRTIIRLIITFTAYFKSKYFYFSTYKFNSIEKISSISVRICHKVLFGKIAIY